MYNAGFRRGVQCTAAHNLVTTTATHPKSKTAQCGNAAHSCTGKIPTKCTMIVLSTMYVCSKYCVLAGCNPRLQILILTNCFEGLLDTWAGLEGCLCTFSIVKEA